MKPRPTGLPFRIPAWAWQALKVPGRHLPHRKPAWFWVWRAWRLGQKPAVVPPMFDDVNLSLVPVDAKAVAGYVDGRWPTFSQLVKKFPHAKYRLSIAVFASDDAMALDVEPGDATIQQAAGWVKREKARGEKKPIVYTAVSWAPQLIATLTAAGLQYGTDYLWWSAHYTDKAHLCGPKCWPGLTVTAHATQWTDKVGGKNLDESLCTAEFFAEFSA